MNEARAHRDQFDLEKYLRNSGATRPDSFDWSDPGPRLDDETLFCLGYMMDIESHTVIYMKELLSTSVAEDPSITAFLSCWVYEEFFHSQVLKRLLESQGLAIDDCAIRGTAAPETLTPHRRKNRRNSVASDAAFSRGPYDLGRDQ
jgi:hypothetical protein